jgi:hypothetical protein
MVKDVIKEEIKDVKESIKSIYKRISKLEVGLSRG